MRVKIVTWRDSRIYLEQCPLDSEFKTCKIKSVGYIIKNNQKHIVLAREIIEGEARGVIVIPKENVISCRKLYKTQD